MSEYTNISMAKDILSLLDRHELTEIISFGVERLGSSQYPSKHDLQTENSCCNSAQKNSSPEWINGISELANYLSVSRTIIGAHYALGKHPIICGKAQRKPGGNNKGLRWHINDADLIERTEL